jgi:nitroimidazol reductase NimA-like FMN-containing flavoprotein (pyridoxamine 5'-phosphate oxidase superfamily)
MKNMRRKDREISQQEAVELLVKAEYGVLSTIDNNGQPYGVPLSYVYKDNAVYFHCAVAGQKLENIANNAKVSFCVVGSTTVLPETFGTLYESAVVSGVAGEVHDVERHQALVWLLEKYCSDFMEGGLRYIELKNEATKVIKIEISRVSGKARR